MEPFTRLTAIAAPLDRADVDTDMLIPQRFLRKPLTAGYRHFLFYNDRYDVAGKLKGDFLLDSEPYTQARIIVSGPNFGCGSTREGAVYAVVDFGIRAVIAPSFGAFYASNAYQNGLLPVVLPEPTVRDLLAQLAAAPGAELAIDLPSQTVTDPAGRQHRFEIEPARKERMLAGMDDIAATGKFADMRDALERRLEAETPWLTGREVEELVP